MKKSLLALGAVAVALVANEAPARACGGCFHEPSEVPTVVTDHRMVFAVSRDQSTLYDQIQYTGNPASFAWVLPYSGEITVGLSSDALFGALDAITQTRINPPPQNCPPPGECEDDDDDASFAPTAGKAAHDADDGVSVLKREVVGPYETVQLKATDANALQNWLAQNGYNLPADVQPIVTQYQNEHFDFLALKLRPGQGVSAMRPIRVTTKGASVALPLRMVGAGTGATVGITLWIVAEGRYQPQNFASFHIEDDELAWDWDANKSNYVDLRAQKTAAANGAAWEIESSISTSYPQVMGAMPRLTTDVDEAYPPAPNDGATSGEALAHDLDTLFAGIGAARVTRLRADLAHAALDHDLVVGATPDQALLSNVRTVTREANEPMCTIYDGCTPAGSARRSKATEETKDNNDGCTTTKPARSGGLELVLALVALGARRRKQR